MGEEKKLNYKDYTGKTGKDFNILTRLYQIYALRILFIPLIASIFYNFKLTRNTKLLPNIPCIAAGNHICYFDPFIMSWATNTKLAFMAKKELFEISEYLSVNISRLGGFPVNREKLEVSTIKTANAVLKKGWSLCIFPQGGIRKNKKIEEINKGFVVIAKMTKTDILPVAISGLEKYNWNPFKRPLVEVKTGKLISYQLDDDEIIQNWRKQISELTGYELL